MVFSVCFTLYNHTKKKVFLIGFSTIHEESIGSQMIHADLILRGIDSQRVIPFPFESQPFIPFPFDSQPFKHPFFYTYTHTRTQHKAI
jgi:hypothetical protein